ncbi:MAG TPA: hypothetical protein VH684_28430 [Xanthobacteraceae bacterium]|jgi:TPP-dependent indolepyruvate ferredoxin oxidoreductase alpha subunit
MSSWIHRALEISAVAALMAAFACGGVTAQETKQGEQKAAACRTIKDETACTGREDCSWVNASAKRRAFCRAKPKSRTRPKQG